MGIDRAIEEAKIFNNLMENKMENGHAEQSMNGEAELQKAVNDTLDSEKMTEEEQFERANKRADQIVKGACLGYMQLTPAGIQACKMVEQIMSSCVRNMALVVPDD